MLLFTCYRGIHFEGPDLTCEGGHFAEHSAGTLLL